MYKWIHAMFVFWGQGYLTRVDFVLALSIYLQISLFHFLTAESHFLYPFIHLQTYSLFPVSGYYEYNSNEHE